MDEQLVLTAQTLKLNPDLQRADTVGDVFVVKNVPARRYLTVSTEQWNLLRNFANPATVPDVLRAVILVVAFFVTYWSLISASTIIT